MKKFTHKITEIGLLFTARTWWAGAFDYPYNSTKNENYITL